MPEVQLKDKAQDKGSEESQKVYTFEELKDALETDPDLRKEFMQNEDKFITVSEAPPPPAPASKEAPDAEKNGDDAVSVLVKPSWLGSYGENRKPDEAIQEMAKGNTEKDKTITYFKDEKIPALETEIQKANDERKTLKQQIADYEKKLSDDGGKAPAAPAAEVKIPDLPEEDMFYTEDGQKKVKTYLEAINQDRNNLRAKLDSFEKKLGDVEKKTDTVVQAKEAVDVVKVEFEAIKSFREENKAVFKSTRDTRDIEKDYITFMKDMASVKGVPAFAADGSGRFSKETSDALSSVMNESSEEGKTLRTELEKRNIKLPDDFSDLQTVYAIRDIRNQNYEKNLGGEFVPIPYTKAFKIYQGVNGDQIQKMVLDARKKGHEDLQNAVDDKNNRFAKETPPKGGAGPIDVDNYPTENFMKLVDKGRKRTEEENDLLRTILRAKNFPDREIDSYMK